MTSNPTPLPPTTILSSKPISQSAAHEFLRAFLDRADNDASLQPNALITEKGPVSRTATAAAPNLALHSLKRVQAGLAGEVLGRDLSSLVPPGGSGGAADDAADMWEEKKEERTGWEEDEGSSVNVGTAAVNGEVDEGPAAGTSAPAKKLDKEERKRLKKERRKAEKKARREQAKQAKDAEAEEEEEEEDDDE